MSELPFSALKRDPATNDLVLPIQLVHGREAIAQRLRTRFHFFRSEWFLNRLLGVPYFQNVFVKNPNERIIRLVFIKVITTTPGIQQVLSFKLERVRNNRNREVVEVDFEARLTDGTVFSTKPSEFIITVP